jgi:hypothetical protein
MNGQKKFSIAGVLFLLLFCVSAGTAAYLGIRLRTAERTAAEYSGELGRIRAERDGIAGRFDEAERGLGDARRLVGELRGDVGRIADASGRRVGTLREAVAAIRETAEVVESMEGRLSWFERAYGGPDSPIDTAVNGTDSM